MSAAAVVQQPLERENLVARLDELREELAKGTRRAEALEAERQDLRTSMLRIHGAIQVLEELLDGHG